MKKILFTLLLVLFTVPSLANAGVVGKGLKCEAEEDYIADRNYPYFYYFKDKRLMESFTISDIVFEVEVSDYRLDGTDLIKINHSSFRYTNINRETLRSRIVNRNTGQNNTYSCTLFNSRETIIREIGKIINEGQNKNKF